MEEDIQKIRHSLAHLLASAIMESYPKTKLGIGNIEFGCLKPWPQT